ncbi:MAG: CarD family transcriptional regulator [Rickettsiales bacterium]|nr:CarD family transcriptional regulator [Rickettsiales bacterium]
MSTILKFKQGAKVVYPSHGVGEIRGVETQKVGEYEIKTYVIEFEKEKMILRIPVARAEKSGLRALSGTNEMQKVSKTLLERPKSSRGMWSRRAKEYETKINSGNIISVAEVVRDLHKNVDDPERSYSERIIYENALERLSREVSAVRKIDLDEASVYLVKTMNEKNPYFIKKAQEAAKRAAELESLEADNDDESENEDSIAA